MLVALLVFLAASLSAQGLTGIPGVQLQDEGTSQGQVTKLNCVGSTVACTKSGATGTLTITGGGATWTAIEVDFGSLGAQISTFSVVTDATVSATSKIMILQSGIAATGRLADENELDAIICRAMPGTGVFTLYCDVHWGLTHGLFKVNYSVN